MTLEAGTPNAGFINMREHHKITDDTGNKFVEIRGINDAGTAYNTVHVDDTGTLKTSAGGGGGGGTVDQGTGGASAWLVKISQATTDNDVDADIRVGGTAVGNANPVPVSDAGGSITVDGPLTDTQLRATPVPVSGTVAVIQSTTPWDTELTTKDYDTGAGADNVAVVGILLPKSGGSVAGGTSTDPIRVDPTGTTTQPVSIAATVTVDTELPAAAALADGATNPTTPLVGECMLQFNGTTWDRVRSSFSQTRNTQGNNAGAGAAVDMTTTPMASFAILVVKDGGTTLSSYSVTLEGSLDNATWISLANNTNASGTAQIVWTSGKPVLQMRSNVGALAGTGTPTVKVVILACRAIA